MYKVFNMGHRMEIYLDPEWAEDIIIISEKYNVDAQIIGHVEASEGAKVTIRGDKGVFKYTK